MYELVDIVFAIVLFVLLGAFLVAFFHYFILKSSNPPPLDGKRPWWRRKRYAVLLALLVGLPVFLVARHTPKYLYSHSEQDLCEFGTGSTALYDRLRAEAETYLQEHGYAQFEALTVDIARAWAVDITPAFAKRFEEQIQDFAISRPTATERWVAVHALLRAYGMDFDNNGPRDERLALRKVHLRANYYLLLPKFKRDCPLCYVLPEARLNIHMKPREGGIYDQARVRIHTRELHPGLAPLYYRRARQICPKVLN